MCYVHLEKACGRVPQEGLWRSTGRVRCIKVIAARHLAKRTARLGVVSVFSARSHPLHQGCVLLFADDEVLLVSSDHGVDWFRPSYRLFLSAIP